MLDGESIWWMGSLVEDKTASISKILIKTIVMLGKKIVFLGLQYLLLGVDTTEHTQITSSLYIQMMQPNWSKNRMILDVSETPAT